MDELDEAYIQVLEEKLIEDLNLTLEDFERFKRNRDKLVPEMYDLNVILDDTIVGEHHARMSLFTIFILSKICSYVSGPSAGGKTALMDAVLDTLMPGDGVVVEGGSDKAIFDKEREIKKARYFLNPKLDERSNILPMHEYSSIRTVD